MNSESYHTWKTPLSRLLNLASLVIKSGYDGTLEIRLEDIDTGQKWLISFREILGYKFETNFNESRMGNTFIVTNSFWIEQIKRKPFLAKDIGTAKHYLIDTLSGEINVVTLADPQ